jgi:hypothetical protein
VTVVVGMAMRSRISRTILNLFFFIVTEQLVSQLWNAVEYLLLKAGSPVLRDWDKTHFGTRAFFVGILAGLLNFRTILATFGWLQKAGISVLASIDLERSKRWTWVFFSPLFVMIVMRWFAIQGHSASIFDQKSPYTLTSLFNYFASLTDCVNSGDWIRTWDIDCMTNALEIRMLLCSVGYSLAPLIRDPLSVALRKAFEQPMDSPHVEGTEESTMNEKIDSK